MLHADDAGVDSAQKPPPNPAPPPTAVVVVPLLVMLLLLPSRPFEPAQDALPLPPVVAPAPPGPTEIMRESADNPVNVWETTCPPPPPPPPPPPRVVVGAFLLYPPAPPPPPLPTTRTSAEVTPAGTLQLQVVVLVKVKIV